jgi:hypothetical protein
MKIEITPKEPMRIRVRYNGEVVYDQKLEAGRLAVIEAEHPKTCGKAEAFIVEEDGSEFPIGSADYGNCECAAGTKPEACNWA